MTTTTKSNKK